MSDIHLDLIEAYKNAYYRVFIDEGYFDLRLGEKTCELEEIYHATGADSALFITAFNPWSKACSEEENNDYQSQLITEITRISTKIYQGEGGDLDMRWPPEKSILVLGIDRSLAEELGSRFRQNAIIWAGSDHIPQLILLR